LIDMCKLSKMQEFETLADYCLNYFKNNYKYELDNIFIDQIQYSVQLYYYKNRDKEFYQKGKKEMYMKIFPTFDTDCGINGYQRVHIQYFEEELDKNILIQFLKECKEKLIDMKSSIFALHSRNEKYGHEIKKYEKSDYNAKLEFLKSINQEGRCYICKNPTLNTEHLIGCNHNIHLKCLYQKCKKTREYKCGLCDNSYEWEFLFCDHSAQEENDQEENDQEENDQEENDQDN
jgi:hypothetical protein